MAYYEQSGLCVPLLTRKVVLFDGSNLALLPDDEPLSTGASALFHLVHILHMEQMNLLS